ncbi:unnamed protein product [Rangifer tarandus platyrhynchus]|uniref:Uncharacterized protein n=1 Tax=Rangifer tarandus platyrhynchus TaxID=3082113 RepID=A0AC59Y613_RANTA
MGFQHPDRCSSRAPGSPSWTTSSSRRRGSIDILLPIVRLALGCFLLPTWLRRKSTSTLPGAKEARADVARRGKAGGRPRSLRRRSSAAEPARPPPAVRWVRSGPASRPPWSSGVVYAALAAPLDVQAFSPFQFFNQNISILSHYQHCSFAEKLFKGDGSKDLSVDLFKHYQQCVQKA